MSNFAVSDLHGHLKLYNKIKKFLKPEDTVYCLGDCGDRGPEAWETIKAVAKDEQFIYLKGNHEDMLVKAALERLNPDWEGRGYWQMNLYSNGGEETLEGLLCENYAREWVDFLSKLDTSAIYTNTNNQKILLTHAGLTWRGKLPNTEDLLWDRTHYFDGWDDEEEYIIVHGHTPIPYLAQELGDIINDDIVNQAYKYAGGNKYCIDDWTIATGKAILFNLDSFESILFNIKD